ncbi:MAG: hypothetical protein WCL14_02695 [Bacteroidota bacterium]
MVEVILSDFAIEDMQEIYDFIAKDSIHYAEKQIAKFPLVGICARPDLQSGR